MTAGRTAGRTAGVTTGRVVVCMAIARTAAAATSAIKMHSLTIVALLMKDWRCHRHRHRIEVLIVTIIVIVDTGTMDEMQGITANKQTCTLVRSEVVIVITVTIVIVIDTKMATVVNIAITEISVNTIPGIMIVEATEVVTEMITVMEKRVVTKVEAVKREDDQTPAVSNR